jgi:plastocyanin
MKKGMLGVLVLLMAIGSALLGCGKASGGGQTVSVPDTTVQMNTDNFVQTTRTLKAGQTLLFSDTVDGGSTHVICLGQDMQCDAQAQGPSALTSPGFTIMAGGTKSITFPTAGTYQITCTLHPYMNLTVIVQ